MTLLTAGSLDTLIGLGAETIGELNLFYMETQELSRHTIHVYPSDDWEEEVTDVGTFAFSDLNGSEFHVTVPWGKATFYAPLESVLVIRPEKNPGLSK